MCILYTAVSKYNRGKPDYVGEPWFHSKPPTVYRWQLYGIRYMMETELCTITCANVYFRVQRRVVKLESWHLALLMNSNGSAATRKFQSVVHNCGERMEVGWTTGSSVSEWGFLPMYSPITGTIKLCRSATREGLNSHRKPNTKRELNINMLPRYGVITIHNITEICWFRKSVANCDRRLIYKGGQLWQAAHLQGWPTNKVIHGTTHGHSSKI